MDIREFDLSKYSMSDVELEYSSDITVKSPLFDNKDDALEYVSALKKDDQVLAVKYSYVDDDFDSSVVGIDVSTKIKEAISSYNNFPREMIDKLKDQKSELKGCNNCSSRLNRDYLIPIFEDKVISYLSKDEESLAVSDDSDNIEAEATLKYEQDEVVVLVESNTSNDIVDMKDLFKEVLSCVLCKDTNFIVSTTDHNRLESLYKRYQQLLTKYDGMKETYLSKKAKNEILLVVS